MELALLTSSVDCISDYTGQPWLAFMVGYGKGVEGGSARGYIGTPRQRPFKVTGDTLTLGDGRSWKRVLVRVR